MAGRLTATRKIPASIENRLGGLEGQSRRSGDIKITSVVLSLTLTSDRYPCSRRDSNQQSQQPSGLRPTPKTARSLESATIQVSFIHFCQSYCNYESNMTARLYLRLNSLLYASLYKTEYGSYVYKDINIFHFVCKQKVTADCVSPCRNRQKYVAKLLHNTTLP